MDKQRANRNGNSAQQNAKNNRQGSNSNGRNQEGQNKKDPSQCHDSTDNRGSDCKD